MRFIRNRVALLVALLVGTTGAAFAQDARHVVRGATSDSTSNLPVAGAIVQLSGGPELRSTRSDDAGQFRFSGIPAGRYRLSVIRIGYTESARDLELADRDTTLVVRLAPITRVLGAATVRGDIAAIYGVIARFPDLRPLAGAKLRVMGANKTVTTDSAGTFFIAVEKPGTYFVRVTRDGFAEERFPVDIPGQIAVEASRMLEPGASRVPASMEHLFAEVDQRLRWRALNSAFVPGSEIRAAGSTLADGLAFSRSVVLRGLRIPGDPCLFVNGARSRMPLDAFDANEIEAVEVYGLRGNVTATLQCSSARTRRPGVAGSPELVRVISVWLKR